MIAQRSRAGGNVTVCYENTVSAQVATRQYALQRRMPFGLPDFHGKRCLLVLFLVLLACGSSGCTIRYQERTAPQITIMQLALEINAGEVERLRIRPGEVIIFRQNGSLARLDVTPAGDLRAALVAAGAQLPQLDRVTLEIIAPDAETQNLVIILLVLTAPCCGVPVLTLAVAFYLGFRNRYPSKEPS